MQRRLTPSAPLAPLVLGSGLFAALGLVVVAAGVIMIFGSRSPDGAEAAKECRFVAEIASSLGYQRVLHRIGGLGDHGIDCREALLAAGVTVASSMDDVRAGAIVEFERPRSLDDNRVVVEVGTVCGPLCGEGEETLLVVRDGRWTLLSRSPTWIA